MALKVTSTILLFLYSTTFSLLVFASNSLEMDRGDGTKIHYYLKTQKQASDSLLVVIQGSDCNSVTRSKRVEKFHSVMPDADFLTVDKYGIDSSLPWSKDPQRADCPDAFIKNDYPQQRVEDYTQVLAELNKDNKYKKIVLVGGSEGAIVASMLASQLSYIDSTVSFNGGGRKFIDDILYSIKSEAPTIEAYNESADGIIGFSNHILNSEPFDLNMSGHGFKWWRSMLEIDQTAVLSTIDTPLLLIQSGKDINVSPSLATTQAKAITKEKSNVTFKTYNELDHYFNLPDGTSAADSVIQDIRLWLTQK